jgi:hypothetical protein
MRKLAFIILISILSSCAGTYRQATFVSNQVYLGMPIDKFKEIAGKKAILEAMESGYTVYKIYDYDAWTGAITETKFYYFDSNAKLVKIDSGQFRQNRYQIEVINH